MSYVGRVETLAALDLGTTNCRLLIARAGRDGMRVVDSFSRVVRLGEGLEASGNLSEPAMARTLDALKICAAKINGRQVTRARYVATEACRRAANGGAFIRRVRDATGIELEIIANREEARLALDGCAPLLQADRGEAIVFDIGGGSTEIVWVGIDADRHGRPMPRIRDVISLPYGVVSLTERPETQPGRPGFDAVVAAIKAASTPFDRQWAIRERVERGEVQMLGSSGTVTTLAAIQLGLPRYERRRIDGTTLDFADLERIRDQIVAMTPAERSLQPCIGPGRADLMVAGCAIVSAICAMWPVGQLRVADRGVREGILAGLWAGARLRRGPRGLRHHASHPA